MMPLKINTTESFHHLPHAPIVEAVIDIRARPAISLEEATLKSQLVARLEGYQYLDSMQNFQIQHKVNPESGDKTNPIIHDLSWKGLRFQSDDNKHIAQFNLDGFVFSRLEPYESWERLYEKGMRLWTIYTDLAHPVEIHRIGLRYINRIQLPPGELHLESYLTPAPIPPQGLDVPLNGFLHQETLTIPGHDYGINIIRTLQPPTPAIHSLSLILDIDAFTTHGFELDDIALKHHLLEMRWLKNKVFFGNVTQSALKLFE